RRAPAHRPHDRGRRAARRQRDQARRRRVRGAVRGAVRRGHGQHVRRPRLGRREGRRAGAAARHGAGRAGLGRHGRGQAGPARRARGHGPVRGRRRRLRLHRRGPPRARRAGARDRRDPGRRLDPRPLRQATGSWAASAHQGRALRQRPPPRCPPRLTPRSGGRLLDIPLILFFEGLTNGAIYALMALGLVVLYSVTGVINVAIGEFVMISALTVASLRAGAVPGSVYLLVAGLLLWAVYDVLRFARERRAGRAAVGLLWPVAAAAVAYLAVLLAARAELPYVVYIAVAVALPTALGPVLYRVIF